MATWNTQLRKGMLEFAILSLLARGESYGYKIVQSLRQLDGLDVHESTLYPILRRLRKDSLLLTRLADSSGGPPRRYFSLSPIGQRRLAEMNVEWDALAESIRRLREGDLEL